MTIEEKAKAYDEALEKAKIEINTKGIGETVDLCKHLFPELRESEDERITRAINNMLPFIPDEAYANNGVTKEDVLNWLEKQQEQSDKESLNESQQEFVNTVTERMLKEGPIPTLKGKQKAEFEKEFNRFKQITGMINFPAHMEVYKRIILWFMAWGADNLPNLNKVIDPNGLDFQQEQPKVDFEKELKNERTKLLDAFGPMNGEQSLAVRNFARHFVEFGLNARK